MLKQGVNSNGEVLRDAYVVHDPVDLHCPPEEGKTRQEFADEADINVLLAHYERNQIPVPLPEGGQYYEYGDKLPLREALDAVIHAEAEFMRLPASVRKTFDNDPVQFVEFAENPENLEQMRTWGLAPPLPVEPAPVRVVMDAPQSAGDTPAPKPGG